MIRRSRTLAPTWRSISRVRPVERRTGAGPRAERAVLLRSVGPGRVVCCCFMSVHSIGFPEDDISALRAQKYSSGIADQPLLAPNSTEVGVEFEASAEVVAADIKP